MTATFQVGQILQGQEKFDEAIAAWKGYLAKFPDGPQSADAQRAILDTQLLIAADHLRREQYAEARAAWQAFVAAEPARRPRARRSSSRSARASRPRRSTTRRSPPGSRSPASSPAASPPRTPSSAIASIFENEKGDPAAAIERFKKVAVEPWRSQARAAGRRDGGEGADGRHPARLPLGRDAAPQDHHAEPRDAHVHRLQARPRGLLPQEARARRASSRSTSAWSPPTPSGRPPSPATPSTSRSRRPTT